MAGQLVVNMVVKRVDWGEVGLRGVLPDRQAGGTED